MNVSRVPWRIGLGKIGVPGDGEGVREGGGRGEEGDDGVQGGGRLEEILLADTVDEHSDVDLALLRC